MRANPKDTAFHWNLWRRGTLLLSLLAALVAALPAARPALAGEAEDLAKVLQPGEEALSQVFSRLDALTGPMSKDVLNGKAEVHVFYGMVIARLVVEQCQKDISLMRSAEAQECPALQAALARRISDGAANLGGALEIIAGSLPLASRSRVGALGAFALKAFSLYLAPLKEFAASHPGREL